MSLNKISLMDAYMIETLRIEGISDKQILAQVTKGDVTPWTELNATYDFSRLVKLAQQDTEAFRNIITEGYAIKFVTIKGIKNLLKMKFDIEIDDYEVVEKGITNLKVNEKQESQLKQMLSMNWNISETASADSNGSSKEISILVS
ncbi:hypothetical protein NC797_06180 [Aquibacillus sp. 3ASR75-11]|uniref:Uncharacterized protein n=1 Tax=Terrihalobacillus insolitus TaxID=2950438 RepID=A0A9X3WVC4_9BACI|nr:hypothetical protein [Terrihalobacillus insolitus]MDC3414005.1 hypothetical protein [Terrihalobacillus insolitus]MDC3424094.1 hypothetical protein [Terrihalobacillus insolitus]